MAQPARSSSSSKARSPASPIISTTVICPRRGASRLYQRTEPKLRSDLLTGTDLLRSFAMGQDKKPDWGEGNYEAAREYDKAVEKTAKDQKKVEEAARDAEEALDGDEAEELHEAEEEGLSHAKR